jgi:hypothetical protein
MGVSSESLVGPSRERMYCLGHAPVMADETMGSLCSGLKKQSKAILFSLWAEGVDIEFRLMHSCWSYGFRVFSLDGAFVSRALKKIWAIDDVSHSCDDLSTYRRGPAGLIDVVRSSLAALPVDWTGGLDSSPASMQCPSSVGLGHAGFTMLGRWEVGNRLSL